MDFNETELAEFFEYLDELRESGATNMFGAAPYLTEEFDMNVRASRSVLTQWMETYDGAKTPVERAATAFAG
jgi:hypothetical protein